MSKEQYVSFKVAKLLKEKGFCEENIYCYYQGEYKNDSTDVLRGECKFNWNVYDDSYSAPTQQMAIRWLWEEKGLNVNAIYGDYPSMKKAYWMPQIDSLKGCYGVDDEDFFREYNSREDCIEAALEYALRNLI